MNLFLSGKVSLPLLSPGTGRFGPSAPLPLPHLGAERSTPLTCRSCWEVSGQAHRRRPGPGTWLLFSNYVCPPVTPEWSQTLPDGTPLERTQLFDVKGPSNQEISSQPPCSDTRERPPGPHCELK